MKYKSKMMRMKIMMRNKRNEPIGDKYRNKHIFQDDPS